MTTVEHLESLAQQLAARLREDEPEANLRWLRAELGTDPQAPVSDVERLLFVLAAGVPISRSWSSLTQWTYVDPPELVRERRVQLDQALRRAA